MAEPASTLTDLHAALHASLPFGPSYPGSSGFPLFNHLPMGLQALHRLGASRAVLDRHLELALPRLVRVTDDSASTAAHSPAWTHPERTAAYLRALHTLEGEARTLDDATLSRRHLPRLLEVPEAAGFHGLIRLAHALEAAYRPEMLRSLAAWETLRDARLKAPDDAPGRTRSIDVRSVLAQARHALGSRMAPRKGTSIVSDLVAASALPGFEDQAVAFTPSLDDLAEASLAVYLATRDFIGLHLVTAVRAARVVLGSPSLDDATRALAVARLARAWLAAWASIGAPEPAWAQVHAGVAREDDWRAALPTLFACDDDHVIKLADAAREEWRHRGWPGYAACLPGSTR